jgi:formylmethanofuran dehydrogenase subunit C
MTLRQAPALRVDMRGVLPAALADQSVAQIERLLVGHGNTLVPLGEFFSVQTDGSDGALVLDGDLSRVDRIGWQMALGRITVKGPAGHYAGAGMSGGELLVQGSVGLLAACEMAGGRLTIDGDAGDFAASTLPGSMDGMRGGTLVIKGHVGERCGDRMRRGSVIVFGNSGDFLASRMVAGTIALGGHAGDHAGYAMRRGSIVFAGGAPEPSPTFVPAVTDTPVFWQLLARDLAQHGGVFAGLPQRRIERWLGDLAADGKGEWLITR